MTLEATRQARAKTLKSLAVIAVAWAASAATDGDSLGSLRAQDDRLLRIAEPIMARNAPLCDRTMPALGIALQSVDQYPANARPSFAGPVAFASVLPGSAAAQAGIAPDDLQRLRAYASQERALGDERFQHMVETTLGRPAVCRPRGRPRQASLREPI